MRIRISLAIVAFATFAVQGLVRAQVSIDDATQLRAAHYKEDVTGDLAGAVADYQRLAVSHDRATAAQALLSLGHAYELSGSPNAPSVYVRVTREFVDQPSAVAIAKTRLMALATPPRQAAGQPPTRMVSTTEMVQYECVSADGRMIVGRTVDRGVNPTFALVVQDLSTGQSMALVKTTGDDNVDSPTLSPDGRFVAYRLVTNSTETASGRVSTVRVIGTQPGASSFEVLGPQKGPQVPFPVGWSADGKAVLVMLRGAPRAAPDTPFPVVEWVSIADHTTKPVTSFERSRQIGVADSLALSPTGTLLAYSALARTGSTDRHIFVMDLAAGQETEAVTLAGANTDPVWTANGGALLFRNDRAGRPALWSVSMRGASPVSEPTTILADSDAHVVGTTLAGEVLYSTQSAAEDSTRILIADEQPKPMPVTQIFEGESVGWSPDGKSVAFLLPSTTKASRTLTVRSLDTGEERSYPHPGLGAAQIRWTPDGTSLLVFIQGATDGRPGGSMYLVDVKSGEYKWLFARQTTDHARDSVDDLSPDGKTLYASVHKLGGGPATGVSAVDLATGAERSLVTFPGDGIEGGVGLAVSPDGKTLVAQMTVMQPNMVNAPSRLMLIRTDGSGTQDLPGTFGAWTDDSIVRWTPDGQWILFFDVQKNGDWALMRISPAGGVPEVMGLDSKNLAGSATVPALMPGSVLALDVSPDGTRVAVGVRAAQVNELWKMTLAR